MAVKINQMSRGGFSDARIAMANLLGQDNGWWNQIPTIAPEGQEEKCITLAYHKDRGMEHDFAITISDSDVVVCQEKPTGFIRKSAPHLGLRATGANMSAFLQLIRQDLHMYRHSCHLVRESYTKQNVKEMAEHIRTNPEIKCEAGCLKQEKRA
jgi:hypothetical protein